MDDVQIITDGRNKAEIIRILRLLYRLQAQEVADGYKNPIIEEEITAIIAELKCYEGPKPFIDDLKPQILKK